MQLASVNIGDARPIAAKRSAVSGIFKRPHDGPVAVTRSGLAGDTICDTKHHGGVDQAVYGYGTLDYAWWSDALGRQLEPGTFGENLTVSDLESAGVHIGDRYHIAGVVLEVTAPRIPCLTLATRMGDSGFTERFIAAERPGFYCRVIRAGMVRAGAGVVCQPHAGPHVTIAEMFRDWFHPIRDQATLRRYLAVPIHYQERARKKRRSKRSCGIKRAKIPALAVRHRARGRLMGYNGPMLRRDNFLSP